MTRLALGGLLLVTWACTDPPPLPDPTGTTAETGADTAPTGDTGGPTFVFDVVKEATYAFRADQGITLGANSQVTAWADVGGNAIATVVPPDTEGISIFVDDGSPALCFDGASNLAVDLGRRFTDATIVVRFRFDATQSDNDYLYAIGDGLIDTLGGTTMSLSRGNFEGQGAIQSYHYTGKDDLYGERIGSDVWITSTQLYRGKAQPVGVSHHTLFLDGDDALMDPSDTPYDVLGQLTIGNYTDGEFRLDNAEIRGFVIFDRVLEAKEIAAVEAWMAKL